MKDLGQKYLFVFLMGLALSCEYHHIPGDCVIATLKSKGMILYNNQELGCKNFLSLYEFNGAQYFILENNCADMIRIPFGCDGQPLCEIDGGTACADFHEDAVFKGIVGIAP